MLPLADKAETLTHLRWGHSEEDCGPSQNNQPCRRRSTQRKQLGPGKSPHRETKNMKHHAERLGGIQSDLVTL